MTLQAFAALRLTGLSLVLLLGCSPGETPLTPAGACVSSVSAKGLGQYYGLEGGDALTSWLGQPGGSIQSVFDALEVEAAHAARGDVVLELVREGRTVRVPVLSGDWGVELAPCADAALEAHREALSLRAEDPLAAAEIWTRLAHEPETELSAQDRAWLGLQAAESLALAGREDEAERAFAALSDRVASTGLPFEPLVQELIGRAWRRAGDPSRADAAFALALEGRQASNPDSIAVASLLLRWVTLDIRRSTSLAEARQRLESQPSSPVEVARAINLQGNAAIARSQLDEADALYREALERYQSAIPGSVRVATTTMNLALCSRRQAKLDEAGTLVRRALELFAQIEGYNITGTYNILALIERDKGNYREAREAWEKALAGYRSESPESLAVAGILNNLGGLARTEGDLERADALQLEALAIRRKLAPGSRAVASSLSNLALGALRQDRMKQAQEWLEQSLEIKRRLAPGTETYAHTLCLLGEALRHQDVLDEAERYLRECLDLWLEIAPGSYRAAEGYFKLADTLLGAGRREEGERLWRQGLKVLEQHRGSLQFSAQERSIFASRFQDYYRGLAWNLAHAEDPRGAFELLERSYGRSLRVLAGPHAAAVEIESQAISLAEARRALEPGTRLVAYSVGFLETLVAVVFDATDEERDVEIHRIPISRADLGRRVELFRALLERGREISTVEPALIEQGASLFELLLAPALEDLESAERLVLVPDTPLYTLPFAALVESRNPLRFVGEWKPLSYTVSATYFASAKERRRPTGQAPTVAVFADSGRGGPRPEVGEPLPELPGVGLEAQKVRDLFPDSTVLRLDREARESTFKAAAGAADYLHLATHALVDPNRPLDSALVLRPGDGEDGLLHAREVIEELELGSDLVTLSACNTGRGRELGGEGVLGLSHAFLFAGARTILVSLWPVADDSTAAWIETFYGNLGGDLPRDRAVFEAQRNAIHGPIEGRHPYHWAAFQLWGDWSG